MRLRTAELRRADAELGRRLRRFADLRLHRLVGCGSFDEYARDRLGISPAKANALIAVERRCREQRELASAYRSGELSWVRALALLPVAGGGHGAAWVARAREVMVRRLQDEVEWALDRRDACGVEAAPPPVDAVLERPDLQTCARSSSAYGERLDRRVTFYGPASVVVLVREQTDRFRSAAEPQWRGLERLLLHVIAEWEAEPRHRDPVFARDGWRCAVPGCSSRRSLQDHHVIFRSRGGGNEPDNRVAACASHHLHGIHRGRVRVRGRAPDDLVWELGVSPGRAPLLVLHGERWAGGVSVL